MRRFAILGVVVLGLLAGSYLLMNARTVQLFGEILHRVPSSERVVALTFDDGPTPAVLGVLAMLEEADARATFFVTGAELAAHRDLGAEVIAAGHELGNHSWSHQRMLFMTRSRIAEEIERTDALIAELGQTGPIHFRPPYGKKLVGLPRYLADHDRPTIMADVEPESDPDVASDAERIVEHVLDHVEPGSIVVLHPMYEANERTRQALPDILDGLAADGYRFVTVTELLDRAPTSSS